VLSPEVEIAQIDARHWRNGWHLLVPPRVLARPRWALVVLDGGVDHVAKVIVAGDRARGSIDPTSVTLRGLSSQELGKLASELAVGAVIVVERALLPELARGIEHALRLDQDPVAQGLVALRVVKQHAGRGLCIEPSLLDALPVPTYDAVQRTFDLLVPDRASLVAYVIEDDRQRIHTSVIATKVDGEIARVATHRAIADVISDSAMARDWRAGARRVLAAVEERYAKPALGVFLERSTLQDILVGPADQLARELNARRVLLDPAPAWLLGLLGGAAVAAVAGRAATALAKMLPQGARDRAAAFAQRAKDAIDPFALLGFDPLELWQRIKHYYRAS
jgi:hypothetical protein